MVEGRAPRMPPWRRYTSWPVRNDIIDSSSTLFDTYNWWQ